jgi:isocitrate/isopropylmalate dehydrogenase
MVRKYRIGILEGDGIGPEIVQATLQVLQALGIEAEFIKLEGGYTYYKRTGKVLQEDFFEVVKSLHAILKGPLYTPPDSKEFRSVNVLLRQRLDLYANVRLFRSYRGISLKNFNFAIVRENTEDLYVGAEYMHEGVAVSLKVISVERSRRICNFAFRYAELNNFKSVAIVHKANILKLGDGLFRDVCLEVAKQFPHIRAYELLVDTAGFMIVKNPDKLEVMVMPNLYGDILSDVAAGVVGSLGLCGSAQIGNDMAVFEPVHGVAFDVAGKGIANPIGELEAARLMLLYLADKHGDNKLREKASMLEVALHKTIEEYRILTPDLGGTYKTQDMVNTIIKLLNILEHS